MANEIITQLILDLDQFKKSLETAQKDGKKGGESTGKAFGDGFEKSAGDVFSSATKKLIALASGVIGAFTLKKVIEEASFAQSALNQFNSALAITGKFSQQASNDFTDYAASLQRTTGISDDLITKNAALLVSVGKLSGQGLKDATRAALDLSAGLGVNLDSAFELITKASQGNVAALSRHGIVMKQTGDKALDFANALAGVNRTFGGLAISQANTFAGSLTKLGSNFSDVLENIGKLIINSPKLVAAIGFISETFAKLARSIETFGKSSNVTDSMVTSFVNFGLSITKYVLPPLELFFNLVNTGFQTIKTGILAIGGLFNEELALKADEAFQKLSQTTENIFNFNVSDQVEKLVQDLSVAVEKAPPIAANIGANIKANIQTPLNEVTVDNVLFQMSLLENKIQVTAKNIATYLNQGIVNGASNAFAAFGKALVTGENLFSAFGKAVLASFGQVLIQLGTQTLAVGLLMANVPILFGLQGAAAIAAGAGMIVAGGVLTAVAGGGGGGGAAGAGGAAGGGAESGGLAGSPGLSTALTQERTEPQTSLVVNVQGNILDRKESGLAIAEIIQDTFGSNGINFGTA